MKNFTALVSRVGSALLLTAGVLALWGCDRPTTPRTGIAEIVAVQGDATVRKAGGAAQQPALAGARLEPRDRVFVQSGSLRIRYDATGEVQEVSASTIIEIK